MIVDGILNLLYAILAPAMELLPDGTFPVDAPSGSSGTAHFLAKFDYLFPVMGPVKFILAAVTTSAMAFLAYRVAIFIYSKIRGA